MPISAEVIATPSSSVTPESRTEDRVWFVAQTQPQKEDIAAVNLGLQNFEFFMPRFRKSRRHARGFRQDLRPVFPGYIFVRFDVMRDHWRAINGTRGINRLLCGHRGIPSRLPTGFLESIGSVDADGIVESLISEPCIGAEASIVYGPFAGQTGRILSLDAKGRVAVLLSVLGGAVPVRLSRGALAPVGVS